MYEVAAQVQPKDIKQLLQLALDGKFAEARKKLYSLLIDQGLSGEDLIKGIHKNIFDLDIPEERKLELLEKTGEAEFRLNMGGSVEIQIEALLAKFMG